MCCCSRCVSALTRATIAHLCLLHGCRAFARTTRAAAAFAQRDRCCHANHPRPPLRRSLTWRHVLQDLQCAHCLEALHVGSGTPCGCSGDAHTLHHHQMHCTPQSSAAADAFSAVCRANLCMHAGVRGAIVCINRTVAPDCALRRRAGSPVAVWHLHPETKLECELLDEGGGLIGSVND